MHFAISLTSAITVDHDTDPQQCRSLPMVHGTIPDDGRMHALGLMIVCSTCVVLTNTYGYALLMSENGLYAFFYWAGFHLIGNGVKVYRNNIEKIQAKRSLAC